ncbi:IspD/TarI family cytidylyltransferase [Thalassiella azotivora]
MPKAFVTVGGRTLLEHALERVLAADVVSEVVLVVPADAVGDALVRRLADAAPPAVRVSAVAGGGSRQASVARGLAALAPGVGTVLVHDAARCLTPASTVRAVARAVRAGHVAVVPVVPVTDTVRDVSGAVVDRARLRAVQTPQGFERSTLERAHAAAAAHADDETLAATDDAGLVERTGHPVHLVDGSAQAFKVTTATDLLLAEALVAQQHAPGRTQVTGAATVPTSRTTDETTDGPTDGTTNRTTNRTTSEGAGP